jgi:cyanophycin synthetase
VLLENHVEGVDHRLTVVNDKVLWAYSKVPSAISGDGHSSVRMLIERENAFRNATKDTGLTILEPIPVDARLGSFLARRHGVGLDTILADGRRIELASEANISRGGVLQDVTARLHPDNRALALRVARYLRMNALGIDFVTPDISRSWKDVPCAIIEVNRTPGLSGVADAALAIRTLFPRKRSGQIPVFVAIGDAAFRDRASARLASAVRAVCARVETIEYLSREAFPPVIGGERPRPVQMSVLDPEIDALVLACDPEWIAERGFPLARADLALTEDPAAAAFLGDIIDEISPLPPEEDTVKRKVAAILADHADDGEPIPVVTFAAFENGFRIRCKRFATFPREQFCSELGLANDGTNHMVNFDDVFSAIWHLANAALEKAGAPRLGEMIDYSPPASAWTIRSVEGTISAREDTAEQTAQAVSVAIDAVNALFASGPD